MLLLTLALRELVGLYAFILILLPMIMVSN